MSDVLFEQILNFPDPDALKRYNGLVGVDATKERLEKEAEVMLRPDLLENWSKDKYNHHIVAIDTLLERPPLLFLQEILELGKRNWRRASATGWPAPRTSMSSCLT
jgi:hypothetical protein